MCKSVTKKQHTKMLRVFCFLLMVVSICAAIPPPFETYLIESSKKCVASIAEKYFVERPSLTVFTTNTSRDSSVLQGIYQSGKHDKKLIYFTKFKVKFWDYYTRYSIIVGRDLNDFIDHDRLDNLALWNARSKYIFYTFVNCENMLQKFINNIWNFYIINSIIIMPSLNGSLLNIYTYFPYNNSGAILPILIDTCHNGIFKSNVELFPNKVPLNLHGHPVRIRVLVWSPSVLPPKNGQITNDTVLKITEGIEVQLMNAIASIANFTIQFSTSTVPHDWGLATEDGNVTGTIKVLREKGADIGMGSFGPTVERRMYCDYSACHMQESLTWCVPKAQKAAKWKNLLEPFKIPVWVAIVISYLSIATIIWLLCYCPPNDASTYIKINNSLTYIFGGFFGISTYETPTKISSRILFIFWLIFALQIVVAYQAQLIGVLLRPTYERQISTFEEVLNSGLKFQILHTHRRFYSNTDNWMVAKIIKDWNSCHDADACLKLVAFSRAFALCTLKAHAEFEGLQYRDADGEPLVYCIDYLLFTSELYMTKGFPLKDRIDKLIYRVRDSGLMFKWQKDLQWIWSYKYRHTIHLTQKEQVLTLAHLQGAFAVLTMGLLIAFIFFICELFYYKYLRKL